MTRVVGIAGTAKNTGKTTALNALLRAAREHGTSVGVTSIGYDGESIDTVTGLPKPRIVLEAGTIAATSESCVPPSGWEIIERTGLRTALGDVVIVRCAGSGPIVLAGPNTRADLGSVLRRMSAHGPSLMCIDGALNRLAPMRLADGLVIATGAARHADLSLLSKETKAIEALFAIPRADEAPSPRDVVLRSPFPTLDEVLASLDRAQAHHGASEPRGPTRVVCDALVGASLLAGLARPGSPALRVDEIVLRDPVTCLLAAPPLEMAQAVRSCRDAGIRVRVGTRMPLLAVTINPFLPRPNGSHYVSDAVSAVDLSEAMRQVLRVPVVDVVREGPEVLWQAVCPPR